MIPSAAGAIVLGRFPFSDLSRSKLRLAMVLAVAGRADWILCQITSNPYADARAIMLSDESFRQGGFQRTSYARPGKLFTANHELMVAEVGLLTAEALRRVIDAVVEVLHGGLAVYARRRRSGCGTKSNASCGTSCDSNGRLRRHT